MTTHPDEPIERQVDEDGRYRVPLSPAQMTSRRMSLREVIDPGRAPRGRKSRLRTGSGHALSVLIGATVVLSGAWAVQDVVMPANSANPQRSLWVAPDPQTRAGDSDHERKTVASADSSPSDSNLGKGSRDDNGGNGSRDGSGSSGSAGGEFSGNSGRGSSSRGSGGAGSGGTGVSGSGSGGRAAAAPTVAPAPAAAAPAAPAVEDNHRRRGRQGATTEHVETPPPAPAPAPTAPPATVTDQGGGGGEAAPPAAPVDDGGGGSPNSGSGNSGGSDGSGSSGSGSGGSGSGSGH